MKVFIDTHVLISAIVFDKKELEAIIRCASEGYEIYISEHIVEEATRVFMKKFPAYMGFFEDFVKVSGIKIIGKEAYADRLGRYVDVRDRYDAHVFACAEYAGSDYIISGDRDILNYKKSRIKTVNAAEFLKHLKEL